MSRTSKLFGVIAVVNELRPKFYARTYAWAYLRPIFGLTKTLDTWIIMREYSWWIDSCYVFEGKLRCM